MRLQFSVKLDLASSEAQAAETKAANTTGGQKSPLRVKNVVSTLRLRPLFLRFVAKLSSGLDCGASLKLWRFVGRAPVVLAALFIDADD